MYSFLGDYRCQIIIRSIVTTSLKVNFDVLFFRYNFWIFLIINCLNRDDRGLFNFGNFLFVRILLNLRPFLIRTFRLNLLLSLRIIKVLNQFQLRFLLYSTLLTPRKEIYLLPYLAFTRDQTIFLGCLCQVPWWKLVEIVIMILIFATKFLIVFWVHVELIHLVVVTFKIVGWFTIL